MTEHGPHTSPGKIVRAAFAATTVTFGVIGILLREPRALVAAGAFGVIWTLWDLVWDRLLAPLGDWATRAFMEGGVGTEHTPTRPTLDDTIRLLESHLAHRASRSVEIQAAIRLEEIYRTVRKNPAKARDVVRRITERYPDAPEIQRLVSRGEGEGGA